MKTFWEAVKERTEEIRTSLHESFTTEQLLTEMLAKEQERRLPAVHRYIEELFEQYGVGVPAEAVDIIVRIPIYDPASRMGVGIRVIGETDDQYVDLDETVYVDKDGRCHAPKTKVWYANREGSELEFSNPVDAVVYMRYGLFIQPEHHKR